MKLFWKLSMLMHIWHLVDNVNSFSSCLIPCRLGPNDTHRVNISVWRKNECGQQLRHHLNKGHSFIFGTWGLQRDNIYQLNSVLGVLHILSFIVMITPTCREYLHFPRWHKGFRKLKPSVEGVGCEAEYKNSLSLIYWIIVFEWWHSSRNYQIDFCSSEILLWRR